MSRRNPHPWSWLTTRDWVELVARALPVEERDLDRASVLVLSNPLWATRHWLRTRFGDEFLDLVYSRVIPIGEVLFERQDALLQEARARERAQQRVLEERRKIIAERTGRKDINTVTAQTRVE